MNLVFALKILSDLCYFFFALSSVSSVAAHSGLLLTSPVIVALAAYLARLLHEKFGKRAWLRFLPIALCAACFPFAKTAADLVATVPMIAYLAFVVIRKNFIVDYDTLLSRFFLCMKLLPIPALLLVIANNWDGLREVMLPYLFFYLVLTVTLLRMLRHNEKVLADRRFRLMNIGEIALLCGSGYLLSSGYMMMAFRFLLGLVIRFVLKPILTGIVYVLAGFAWLLNKVFSGIDFHVKDVDLSQLNDLGQQLQQGQPPGEEQQYQDTAATRILTYILIGVGVLIIVVVIVLLFRALMKAGRREDDNKFDDVRESLDENEGARADRLTRAPRDRVRHYYRKFLKLCDARGFGTGDNLTSQEINDQVRPLFGTPALPALRGLYIKARYSTIEVTPEEAKEAKEAYEEVRKKAD